MFEGLKPLVVWPDKGATISHTCQVALSHDMLEPRVNNSREGIINSC